MNALTPAVEYYAVMQVMEYLRQGKTFTEACRFSGITPRRYDVIVRDDVDLREQHDEAVVYGHDALADVLVDYNKLVAIGSSEPSVMRMLSENIKWLLARRAAKLYGDKVVVEHSITADKAIIEALDFAKQRALSLQSEPVDVTPVTKKAPTDVEDAFVIPDMSQFD